MGGNARRLHVCCYTVLPGQGPASELAGAQVNPMRRKTFGGGGGRGHKNLSLFSCAEHHQDFLGLP